MNYSPSLNMTPRRQAAFDFIVEYRRREGFAPTIQEIADGLKVSKVTVFEYLKALQAMKLIAMERFRARSIRVLAPTEKRPIRLPVLGEIGDGKFYKVSKSTWEHIGTINLEGRLR